MAAHTGLVVTCVLFVIGLVPTTATNLSASPFSPRPTQMVTVVVLTAVAFRLPPCSS